MKNTRCFRVGEALLIMSGIWVPRRLEGSQWRYLYYVYSLSYQTLVYYPMLHLQIKHLLVVLGDVGKMMQVLLLFITHFSAVFKFIIICIKQSQIKQLVAQLDSPQFNPGGAKERALLDHISIFLHQLSKTFVLLVIGTGCLWGAQPLLTSVIVLPLGYPYIQPGTAWFAFLYVYELLGMMLLGLSVVGIDLLIGVCLYYAAAELDILGDQLTNIQHNDNVDKALADCIQFHQVIIRYLADLEDIFSWPLLFYFVVTSLSICGVIYQVNTSNDYVQIFIMFCYLSGVLTQLTIYCLFGDMITSKGLQLAVAVYSCDWHSMSVHTRRLMLLIMARAQRPLTVTAGHMINLNISTFAAVFRTSYSYYAVLNQRK